MLLPAARCTGALILTYLSRSSGKHIIKTLPVKLRLLHSSFPYSSSNHSESACREWTPTSPIASLNMTLVTRLSSHTSSTFSTQTLFDNAIPKEQNDHLGCQLFCGTELTPDSNMPHP